MFINAVSICALLELEDISLFFFFFNAEAFTSLTVKIRYGSKYYMLMNKFFKIGVHTSCSLYFAIIAEAGNLGIMYHDFPRSRLFPLNFAKNFHIRGNLPMVGRTGIKASRIGGEIHTFYLQELELLQHQQSVLVWPTLSAILERC